VSGQPRFSVDAARRELAAAQEALSWALPLISDEDAHAARTPSDWSAATNLAHLVIYEERIAVPVLLAATHARDGAADVRSGDEGWLVHDAEALGREPFLGIIGRYRAIVARHADLLASFDDDTFNRPICSLWQAAPAYSGGRSVPAGWIAKKSAQHTWEHGHALLRAGWRTYGKAEVVG
jgi:hypothetical protein